MIANKENIFKNKNKKTLTKQDLSVIYNYIPLPNQIGVIN